MEWCHKERLADMLRYVLPAVLCFASSLLGSAVTIAVLHSREPEPVLIAEPLALPATLSTKQLLLTDLAGNVRMRLQGEAGTENDPGHMVMYDDRGAPRLRIGFDPDGEPFLTMQNTDLPNPDHKRITLAVNDSTARLDVGHGQLTEIVLLSSPAAEPPASVVRVQGRNGSDASLYTDPYGHATIEVKDLTTATIFRMPGWKPLLPR